MAKILNNPFGGFSGRLGNVVGYSWKGLWCVRMRPAVVRNPRSEAQQTHRAMFAEEVRLAGRMRWALNIGFATVSDELHMTPCNVFVKANQQAFSIENGNLSVDWKALVVSAGPVAPVALGVPQVSSDGVLDVAFEKNPLHMRADNYDRVYAYIYSPYLGTGYLAAPVYRRDRRIAAALPDELVGQELHVFCFVVDSQGRASETCYASVATSEAPILDDDESINPEQMMSSEMADKGILAPHIPQNQPSAPPGLSPNNSASQPLDPADALFERV